MSGGGAGGTPRRAAQLVRKVARGDSPLHAVLLTIVTQSLVVLINVGTGVITARLLGPEGRGIFTATTIWPQFLAGVAGLGLPTAIIYFTRNNPDARRDIAGAAYLATIVASVAATAAGLLLTLIMMPDAHPRTIMLADFCILWTWTNMLSVVLRQIMVASGRFRMFATSSYLPPLFFLLGLLIAWPLAGMTPEIAALCLMLSSLLSMLWMIAAITPEVRPRFAAGRAWLRELVRYSARFAASDLSGTMLLFIDRLMLIPFLSPAELGLYVVAYSLSRLMLVLQTTVGSVLYPVMAGRTPVEIKELHDLAFRLILYGTFFVVVVLSAVAYPALRIVYGADYVAALPLLRILVVEAATTCVGQVVVQLYLSMKHPGFPSVVQTLSLAVATVSLLVLVPRYGAMGGAISLLVASLVRVTVLLIGVRARLGMALPRLWPQVGDVAYVQARLF